MQDPQEQGQYRRRIWPLQVLRFAAATLVLLAHGIDSAQLLAGRTPWVGRGHLENFGAIGVDLFFVISGFIIVRTAFGPAPRPGAGEFMLHRLIRVLPMYYLLSLPWLALAWRHGGLSASQVVTSLFLWPAMPGGRMLPYLWIGWTLCFEMLFYAAVCLAKLGRSVLALELALFLTLMALRPLSSSNALLQFVGNPIILEFLLGVLIALNHERLQRMPRALPGAALALGLAWLAALLVLGFGQLSEAGHTLDGSLSLLRAALFGLPSALIVLGVVVLPSGRPGTLARPLVFWGDASYVMYLIHPLVIPAASTLARAHGWRPDADLWVLDLLAATLLASASIHVLVERPLTRTLRRRLAPRIAGNS